MLTQRLDAHTSTSPATSQSLNARQVRVSPQRLPKGPGTQHFTDTQPLCTVSLGPKQGRQEQRGPCSPHRFSLLILCWVNKNLDSTIIRTLHTWSPSPAALKSPQMQGAEFATVHYSGCSAQRPTLIVRVPPSLPPAHEEESLYLLAKQGSDWRT